MTNQDQLIQRTIRSFVMRTTRITDGQKKSLEQNWSSFGLNSEDGILDIEGVFGRKAETVLEIGFGMGDSFVDMAKAKPEKNFIGIEVHLPGVGRVLNRAKTENVSNIRCYREDAVQVIKNCFKKGSLDTVQLFFPDPWHKTKHHKRRIVQPEFVRLVGQKLKTGGTFHLATDWENYAGHMLKVMEAAEGFNNISGKGKFTANRPEHRPITRFEKRGKGLGHGIWDLLYRKV